MFSKGFFLRVVKGTVKNKTDKKMDQNISVKSLPHTRDF